MRKLFLLFLMLTAVGLAGCLPQVQATPTPTATATARPISNGGADGSYPGSLPA